MLLAIIDILLVILLTFLYIYFFQIFFFFFVFFFFSSRRRHTRFSRDWSSDVCSSDLLIVNERLYAGPASTAGFCGDMALQGSPQPFVAATHLAHCWISYFQMNVDTQRSEEHTSELQSRENLVCRLLLEKKKQVIVAPY